MVEHTMTTAFRGYKFVIPDAAEAEIKRRIEEAKDALVKMAKWKPYARVTVDMDDLVGDTMRFPVLYDEGRFPTYSAVTAVYSDEFWKSYCNPSIWGSVKYDKMDDTLDVSVFLSYDAHPEYADADVAITEVLQEFCESSSPLTTRVGTLELEFGLVPDGMFTIADMVTYGIEAVDPASGVDYVGRQEFGVDIAQDDRDYAYWAVTSYLRSLKESSLIMNFSSFKLEGMLYDAFGKLQEFAREVGENPPNEELSIEVKLDGRYAGTYFKLTFIPQENNK